MDLLNSPLSEYGEVDEQGEFILKKKKKKRKGNASPSPDTKPMSPTKLPEPLNLAADTAEPADPVPVPNQRPANPAGVQIRHEAMESAARHSVERRSVERRSIDRRSMDSDIFREGRRQSLQNWADEADRADVRQTPRASLFSLLVQTWLCTA